MKILARLLRRAANRLDPPRANTFTLHTSSGPGAVIRAQRRLTESERADARANAEALRRVRDIEEGRESA